MSQAAVNRRKSQLFLTSIVPVHDTHDEVIRKKLKRGKFPQTMTGIIKMISLCLQFGSIISWMVLKLGCNDLGILYSNLGGVSLGFVGQLFLFLMFSFGKTVNDPGKWIYSDIGFNFVMSLLTLVTSVLSMKICKAADVQNLSAGLAIGGASVSICSCGALLLMYRFVEDPHDGQPVPKLVQRDLRKSIFA